MSVGECIFENMIRVNKYVSGLVDLMESKPDPAYEF